jgi:hypothetical protein
LAGGECQARHDSSLDAVLTFASMARYVDLGAYYLHDDDTVTPLKRVDRSPVQGQYCFNDETAAFAFSALDGGAVIQTNCVKVGDEDASPEWPIITKVLGRRT